MAGALVYGFGPYQSYTSNVTERTLRQARFGPGVHRHVFDVKFDRAMFERVLERVRPGVVIGTGQHPRARKLRLERVAREPGGGKGRRRVSLALPQTAGTTTTYDAGDYVCNFSMWVVQAWCAKRGARFAFIHVPAGFAPRALEAYLARCLRTPRRDAAARSSPRGPARSRSGRSARR